MQRIARIGRQRALDRVADNGVNEARRVIARQHLQTNERRPDRDGLRHLQTCNGRRVAQLGAVTEDRQRLGES
jgi:hypothetical protein